MFRNATESMRHDPPRTVEILASTPNKCRGSGHIRCLLLLVVAISMSACASVPLKEAGTLTTYGNLGDVSGNLAKRRDYVDDGRLAEVKRVSVVPTAFSR
jgi:hypothetical protein